MKPKFIENNRVMVITPEGAVTLTIGRLTSFADQQHYAVYYSTPDGTSCNGWVPVALLDVVGKKLATGRWDGTSSGTVAQYD